jgi:hypothetical protein
MSKLQPAIDRVSTKIKGVSMTTRCKTYIHAAMGLLVAAVLVYVGIVQVHAQDAVTIQISIKNHRFQPSEIRAPTGKPIILRIKNLDTTPAEFESVSLRVEKIIAGNGEGILHIRPLQPGQYNFFDDFHPETQGNLVVQ